MTYRPTPAGLERDVSMLLYVLRVATANLDLRHNSQAVEETSAGQCYDDPKKVTG